MKIRLLFFLGSAALLLLIWSFFFFAPKKPAQERATLFSGPRKIAPFSFGEPLFSEKNFQRHWTFLFFGFSHCATICPTTLRELKEAYKDLHIHHPELQIVFVTLDPEEDQPKILKHYTASFNPDFIGLRGNAKQVQTLTQQFAVFVGKAADATMVHTSSVFLINPEGQWVAMFPYGLSSSQIQTQFKSILKSTAHA
ncbi:MAG TPA: SCO family protein, partial [Gammaproteobacteria bacterium]|nr:SCO family protein [Gammaproteobacteria bacterium]